MNILLFNSNPVVNKLVTLSAQKTSNTVYTVQNIDEIESKKYDILIIDDELYTPETMEEISNRVEYGKSLYICSKDSKPAQEFTKTLKKPFLPTDLVELMISLSKETKEAETPKFELLDDEGSSKSSNDFDEIQDLENFSFDELDELDDETLDSKTSGFDELNEELDFDELDDELTVDDTDMDSSSKTNDGILDKEELQEVQNLLDETETDEEDDDINFDFEDDLESDKDSKKTEDEESVEDSDDFSFEESGDDDELLEDLTDDTAQISETTEDELDFADEDDDFSFEEETKDEKTLLDKDDIEEDGFSFDETEIDKDELLLDEEIEEERVLSDENKIEAEELSFDETDKESGLNELFDDEESSLEDNEEELLDEDMLITKEAETSLDEDFDEKADFGEDSFDNEDDDLKVLESKIESAVKELSDEDLESEVDEDMLLDIDSLTSRDLKLAIGEEIDENEFAEPNDKPVHDEIPKEDEQIQESIIHDQTNNDTSGDGVEALKKLLKALSNEDVAASLKGMKININITLGDNQ